MARAKGVQRNPIFKLGKAAARRDVRNLRLRAVLKVLAKLPAEYDFDVRHKGVPTPMFGNDRYGDCVIAACPSDAEVRAARAEEDPADHRAGRCWPSTSSRRAARTLA